MMELIKAIIGPVWPYIAAAGVAVAAYIGMYAKGRADQRSKMRQERLHADLIVREERENVENEIDDLSDARVRERLLHDAKRE